MRGEARLSNDALHPYMAAEPPARATRRARRSLFGRVAPVLVLGIGVLLTVVAVDRLDTIYGPVTQVSSGRGSWPQSLLPRRTRRSSRCSTPPVISSPNRALVATSARTSA